MKLLLTALAVAAALAGCAIVPYDYGYHGDRHYRGDYRGEYRYHHRDYDRYGY